MADTDLYSMLCEYASKTHSALVNKEVFLDSISISAKYKARKNEAWKQWAESPREIFQREMDILTIQNLVSLITQNKVEYIHVGAFYTQRLRELWAQCEENAEQPFPDSNIIKDEFPPEKIKTFDFDTEFHSLLSDPPEEELPALKIIMPDGAGDIVLLSSFLNERLLDAAIQKLRFFLVENNFKPLFFNKIIDKLPELERQTDAAFNMIILNPSECKVHLKQAEVSNFLIWTTFCGFVLNTFGGKTKNEDKEIAVIQSASIVRSFSSFYREIAIEHDETIQLNKIFDLKMNQEPFIYTMKNITSFTDENGVTIVDRFSREAILIIIKNKSFVASNCESLPDLIAFHDSENEKWFVYKEKLYEAFDYYRKTFRGKIYKELNYRWHSILKEYYTDPAMKDDKLFEKLVKEITLEKSPLLAAMYSDVKFIVTKEELAENSNGAALAARYFSEGVLKPFPKLLNLERASVLKSIRASMPFWYSVPVFVGILRFFKRRFY
ncbi:MAG: hypothetical protein Pg6A_06150 [Termitinemataceae bacterium]|nr:MAG: hypothetical protein Pg6A_06150 [Termitinemataceae bacterium]